MKAHKLWQNLPKFCKNSQNFAKILKISQNFSKIPKITPHDNFFSTNIICDICDKYELCVQALIFVTLLPSLGAALRGNKDVEGVSTKLDGVDITTLSYNVTIDK